MLMFVFQKKHEIKKTFWHYFSHMSYLIRLFHYLCSVLLDNCHKLPRPVYMLCLELISYTDLLGVALQDFMLVAINTENKP